MPAIRNKKGHVKDVVSDINLHRSFVFREDRLNRTDSNP